MKQDTRCITLTIKNKGHATSMIFVLLTHLLKNDWSRSGCIGRCS